MPSVIDPDPDPIKSKMAQKVEEKHQNILCFEEQDVPYRRLVASLGA
jgi:hypothetical protein